MVKDAESSEKPAVLLLAEQSSTRDLILAYLTMMGCNVTLASVEELRLVDPESFDVIVSNFPSSPPATENVILKFCPTASEKTVVINAPVASPRILELARAYDLRLISEELWPKQLWPAIQEVLAAAQNSQTLSQDIQIAQLIFDSFRLPAPSGIRSWGSLDRQLVYEQEGATIDILIKPNMESGQPGLAGQVMDGPIAEGRSSGLPVLLVERAKTLAQTETDSYGQFCLDVEPRSATALQIRLRNGRWVSFPFESTDWLMTRSGGSQSRLAAEERRGVADDSVLNNQAKEQGNGK